MPTTPQPSGSNLYNCMLQLMQKVADQPEIKTKLDAKGLYLDWWMEQPLFEREEASLPPVAIYFDCSMLQLEDWGNTKEQRAKVQFDVYLEQVSNADPSFDSSTKNAYMNFVPLQIGIHRALHGWKPADASSALKRTAGPQNIPGNARMGKLILQSFVCLLNDATAVPAIETAQIQEILLRDVSVLR
jgi:hypothetical protein